jgi:hypothetical protein
MKLTLSVIKEHVRRDEKKLDGRFSVRKETKPLAHTT